MGMTSSQIIIAIFMLGATIALLVTVRKYMAAASERRMISMLESVGLDLAVASSGDTEAIMKEVRQRCQTCATEDVCERWLVGDKRGDNVFCPNAKIFNALRTTAGAID